VPRIRYLLLGVAIAGCQRDPIGASRLDIAVIAHRGASFDAPEHTIAAYDLALERGADYLELDVARSSDGVLVVIHDATLDRTLRGGPGCSGAVAAHTWAEISGCDAGSWFNAAYPARANSGFAALRTLRLDEVLGRYRERARFYIEIKDPDLYPGIEREVADLITANDLRGGGGLPAVYVQSFDSESLKRMRTIAPAIPRILLIGDVSPAELRSALFATAAFAGGVGTRADLTDRDLVTLAHQLCLVVHPYAAHEPQQMQSLLEMGADGIFSDRPELVRSAVDALTTDHYPPCLPE
jgi:glycerophosphoryl diester phosphodiesterase